MLREINPPHEGRTPLHPKMMENSRCFFFFFFWVITLPQTSILSLISSPFSPANHGYIHEKNWKHKKIAICSCPLQPDFFLLFWSLRNEPFWFLSQIYLLDLTWVWPSLEIRQWLICIITQFCDEIRHELWFKFYLPYLFIFSC